MRLGAAIVVLITVVACSGIGIFQQYEYEEDMYLSLDGTATMYVNSSLPALNALRGTAFDSTLAAAIDREGINAYFTTPVTRVTRITTSQRLGRRFVHVRIAVDDVNKLGGVLPFAWSTYRLFRDGDLVVYGQTVGAPASAEAGTSWTGEELVAFRLHAPSRIVYHNAGAENLRRGNILVWEQTLADRMRGAPLELDVRMEPESILFQTIRLFGLTVLAVALTFGAIILWILRRGRAPGLQKRMPNATRNCRGVG
jgi:hypothetical protein